MALLSAFLVAILPSRIKIWVLRQMGARIGRGCHIGLSVIHAREIEIGDHVRIASFNLLHRLTALKMGQGSRMNGFNWITGAGTGEFVLGHHSAVTRLHFFEASGSIYIGDNSIVAGRGSHFFTHGISSTNLDDVRPIVIGPWCYVGSSSRFVPGCCLSEGTFVGMGAVVTKRFAELYVLVAGNPAVIKKHLSDKDAYFDRAYLPHDHHPPGYSPVITMFPPLHIASCGPVARPSNTEPGCDT
jgi:acetyltransferase-like isoleucine patch superfamily enzyme